MSIFVFESRITYRKQSSVFDVNFKLTLQTTLIINSIHPFDIFFELMSSQSDFHFSYQYAISFSYFIILFSLDHFLINKTNYYVLFYGIAENDVRIENDSKILSSI